MVQQQTMKAAQAMLAGAGMAPPEGGPDERGPMGQYGLLAMIAAREDGCECKACGLLRKVVDEMFTKMLKQAAPAAPGGGPGPDAAAGPGQEGDGTGGPGPNP